MAHILHTARQISHFTLELHMKIQEVFTINFKYIYRWLTPVLQSVSNVKVLSRCPSRCLLRDCETSNLVKIRFQLYFVPAMVLCCRWPGMGWIPIHQYSQAPAPAPLLTVSQTLFTAREHSTFRFLASCSYLPTCVQLQFGNKWQI